MKIQTWVPEKRPIARTIADVPSSREKPVLCWWNDSCVLPAYVNDHGMVMALPRVGNQFLGGHPSDHQLYDQPPTPRTLDEVPDRWIVYHKSGATGDLIFRDSGYWRYVESGQAIPGFSNESHWQLTDHIAVLKETEIDEVMG